MVARSTSLTRSRASTDSFDQLSDLSVSFDSGSDLGSRSNFEADSDFGSGLDSESGSCIMPELDLESVSSGFCFSDALEHELATEAPGVEEYTGEYSYYGDYEASLRGSVDYEDS